MIMMTLMQVDLYTTEQRVSSAPVTINAHKNELVCLAVSQQGGMVSIFVATRGHGEFFVITRGHGTNFCRNKGAGDVFLWQQGDMGQIFVSTRGRGTYFCRNSGTWDVFLSQQGGMGRFCHNKWDGMYFCHNKGAWWAFLSQLGRWWLFFHPWGDKEKMTWTFWWVSIVHCSCQDMKILEANQDVRDQLVLGGDCKHKGNLDKDLGHSKKVNFALLNLCTPDWHLHCKGRRQNLESLQSIFKHKLSHDYFKQGPAGGTKKRGRPGESYFMNKN